MEKRVKVVILTVLTVIFSVSCGFSYCKTSTKPEKGAETAGKQESGRKPRIALIFDDLGENLSDLKKIYGLGIPLTVAVIPGLQFSQNISRIATAWGFTVFIHLPLEPLKSEIYLTKKYKFIDSSLSEEQIERLVREYLDSVPTAIGANNHMGSEATENAHLMETLMRVVKRHNLIFIDSRTSLHSVVCAAAKKEGVVCAENSGFVDAVNSRQWMERKLRQLVKIAGQKGRIIIIAHPKKNTFETFKKLLPELKEQVEFVDIKQFFDLK